MFFYDGVLMDARANGKQGESALYEIFKWDQVDISIKNSCPIKDCKINVDLRAVLLDAVRMKDEKKAEEIDEIVEIEPLQDEEILNKINELFKKEIGERAGSINIFFDRSRDNIVFLLQEIGNTIDAGDFKLCYLDMDKSNDIILIPLGETVAVEVGIKVPKEKIIKLLADIKL